MTIEEKKENLSYIVEHLLFASSVTAFGKLFTETGKNLGRRITNGELKNYNAVYEDFQTFMGLSEEDLVDLVRADKLANSLYGVYKKQLVALPKEDRKEFRFRLLVALINGDWDALPVAFSPFYDSLHEMNYDNWYNYLHCVALFYLKCGRYVVYYKSFERDYESICCDLIEVFEKGYPHRLDLVRVARNYQENPIYMSQISHSVWGLVQLLEIFFSFASHPEHIEMYLNMMELYGWEDNTYWVTPDQLLKEDTSEIWWMSCLPSEQAGKGYYFLSRLKRKENDTEFHLDDLFTLAFFTDDSPRMVQVARPNVSDSVIFGRGEWREEERMLYLDLDDECDLPSVLYQLDKEKSLGKQTHIWNTLLKRLENEEYDNLFKALHEKNLNQQLLDEDYEIVDVIVSRSRLDLVIRDIKKEYGVIKSQKGSEVSGTSPSLSRYSVDLANYEFLRQVSPEDDVVISRHNNDGKLYANWFGLDFMVPLSDFKLVRN